MSRPRIVFLSPDQLAFPPPHWAGPEGLLAIGGDLSPERLLLAYRKGIFPWFGEGDPILWWSPDPRMVFPAGSFRVSKSLGKVLRGGQFRVTFDRAFDRVVDGCSSAPGRGPEHTWITPSMMVAFSRLHELGHAHSAEVWNAESGALVGGVYGLSIGRAFFAESMFSLETNASKVGLAKLCGHLDRNGYLLLDAQNPTAHLKSLGAVEMRRRAYLDLLGQAVQLPEPEGVWEKSL